jgi:hypothetical protein
LELVYYYETYREYNYVPFEKKVDITVLRKSLTGFEMDDSTFRVGISQNGIISTIEFSAGSGSVYRKELGK